jgi:cobalt/nickel transport system permease protein
MQHSCGKELDMSMKMKHYVFLFFITFLIAPITVNAMHIMEGFLPGKWCVIWGVACMPFIVLGAKRIKNQISQDSQIKVLLGVVGAFVFVLSALKLPSVTGSCSHPTGIGLGAILFGPSVMSIVGLIVLLFQALLLAHGGLTTIGANTFSMAIVGGIVAYFTYRVTKGMKLKQELCVFLAAFLGDLCTYICTSLQLAIAFPDAAGGVIASAGKFLTIFAFTQIPLAISEGILSVIVFNLLMHYSKSELSELSIF